MLTSLGFEIAITDIKKGDEVTNDYGTLNIIEPFKCANGPHKRETVKPDDLTRFHEEWDGLISGAMKFQGKVSQPLAKFLTENQTLDLKKINSGEMKLPSILENYFPDK